MSYVVSARREIQPAEERLERAPIKGENSPEALRGVRLHRCILYAEVHRRGHEPAKINGGERELTLAGRGIDGHLIKVPASYNFLTAAAHPPKPTADVVAWPS